MNRYHLFRAVLSSSLLMLPWAQAFSQHLADCRPVSERKQEVGCWILGVGSIGRIPTSPMYWHLDAYPTRSAAQADKTTRGAVVESLGKVWLLTIEHEGWRPAHGKRISAIGPLEIVAGQEYSTQYMEAIFTPGMTAPAHLHSGPEAWYTVAGETCLETSDGRVQVGRANSAPVVVPAGLSMHLVATGSEHRRSLVLILYPSSEPATTLAHEWVPKGLCEKRSAHDTRYSPDQDQAGAN